MAAFAGDVAATNAKLVVAVSAIVEPPSAAYSLRKHTEAKPGVHTGHQHQGVAPGGEHRFVGW